MPLFSFHVGFSDHTVGIDQIEAADLEDAASEFLNNAECLREYDRQKLSKHLEQYDNQFIQLAHGLKGIWTWRIYTEDYEVDILGAHIIQTDIAAPVRTE